MRIYTEFKNMAWKNGKGHTTELIKLESKKSNTEFSFRLSKAKLTTDGNFSQYPGLKRVLILLSGHGVRLQINQNENIVLQQLYTPFSFDGDDTIFCELLNGVCSDFNIIYDPYTYDIQVKYHHIPPEQNFNFLASSHSFLYITQDTISDNNAQTLIELTTNESLQNKFQFPVHILSVVLAPSKLIKN